MSTPALTYFCENGHIVEDVPHGYMIFDEPEKCRYCKSTKIKSVMEWQDFDYEDYNIVPVEPVMHVKKVVSVPIYDVSKLFEEVKDYGRQMLK